MYSFVCITFACSLKTSEYKGIFSPAGKYLSSRAAVIGRVVCLLFLLCCKAEVCVFFFFAIFSSITKPRPHKSELIFETAYVFWAL